VPLVDGVDDSGDDDDEVLGVDEVGVSMSQGSDGSVSSCLSHLASRH
jgi:hypothetical protein